YQWDFGDGSTSNEANPLHTYASAGEYSIGLTVVDNEGASTSVTTTASIDQDSSGEDDVLQNGQSISVSGQQDELQYFTFEVSQ
ncbi:PKD domain-containing protein, partial [Streptococcus suis]